MAFISKEIEELINFRIVEEEKSNRLYLSMAKWLNYNGYSGASKLWAKYADEELVHSKWGYVYLEELDILPVIPALEAPQLSFESLSQICKDSYDHEILITEQCNDLAKAALSNNDFMTLQFAQKYLTEQAEEIGRQAYWIDRIEAFGDSKEALRLLDNEMGCKA